ncbi:MAG TPA: M24 family metallopeptidase [Actinomycetota bacterium]|nr:M24 family metallopeptidase [Actinomycetota bacterium]
MATFLHVGDGWHSPEMRHEIGEAVFDPVIFIEHEGKRFVVCGPFETDIFGAREDILDEVVSFETLGADELVKDTSFPEHLILSELAARMLDRIGASSVSVPSTFPTLAADHLRDKQVTVAIDHDGWVMRRRRKAPWEIEGIERAQRAAETAMLTAARMLRDAERAPTGGLRFEGEPLTAELIRESMEAELLMQGTESKQILIHSGDACLSGHDLGTGPIQADQSCIIDCFPHDLTTGTWSDMTRTFVPGQASEELRNLHAHVRKALDVAFDTLKAGSKDAFGHVAEYFHQQGFPTQVHHNGEGMLKEGFMHSLGHGVGLEVHEKPWMGRRSDELIVGDVVAVEPGLYFPGVGGVRLEDTVLITEDGVEHFTEPFSYDLEP